MLCSWPSRRSAKPITLPIVMALYSLSTWLRGGWHYSPSNNDMPSTFINTLKPKKNGRHFADDVFKRISIKSSLQYVPESPINNIQTLLQIMAWQRLGDKPLSEPKMVSLPTHICVTRPLNKHYEVRLPRTVIAFGKQIPLCSVCALGLLLHSMIISGTFLCKYLCNDNNRGWCYWRYLV